jgi:hypothetical protein
MLPGNISLEVTVIVTQLRASRNELVREKSHSDNRINTHIFRFYTGFKKVKGGVTHFGSRTSCESVKTVTFSKFGVQLWFKNRATLPSHLQYIIRLYTC